jgi:hypothetical protein
MLMGTRLVHALTQGDKSGMVFAKLRANVLGSFLGIRVSNHEGDHRFTFAAMVALINFDRKIVARNFVNNHPGNPGLNSFTPLLENTYSLARPQYS